MHMAEHQTFSEFPSNYGCKDSARSLRILTSSESVFDLSQHDRILCFQIKPYNTVLGHFPGYALVIKNGLSR